jgi:hypothetical protein
MCIWWYKYKVLAVVKKTTATIRHVLCSMVSKVEQTAGILVVVARAVALPLQGRSCIALAAGSTNDVQKTAVKFRTLNTGRRCDVSMYDESRSQECLNAVPVHL